MAGEATLTYNTVPLSFITTRSSSAEAVKDPLGGIDHIYNRRVLDVDAILALSPAGGPVVPPGLPGETPAQTMARIEHLLSVPRRPFVYAVDGVPLFQSDGLDPAGGPTPTPPKITQVTANSFRIQYQIEFATNDCVEKGKKLAWSSIRFSQEQAIDEAGYSTIVTTGRMIGNADVLALEGVSLDHYRGLVVPPMPNGFIRRPKYIFAPDGLSLDFVYVDQELYIRPPEDAVTMDGDFTHRMSKGGKWFAHIVLSMEGKKNVPKSRLMATCLSVAFNRLKRAGIDVPAGGQPMLQDGVMKESFKRNQVTVELGAITRAPNEAAKAGGGGLLYSFGQGVADGLIAGGLGILPGVGPMLANAYLASVIAEEIQKARDDAKNKALQARMAPLGIAPAGLQQWGAPLLGCGMPADPPLEGISPELYGNLPHFRMIAAAFKDPCLENSVLRALDLKKQKKAAHNPAPRTATVTGTLTVSSNPRSSSPVVVLNGLPALVPVSLDRLVDQYPGVFSEYLIDANWMRTENKDVLQGTVSGAPGKVVQWTNPEGELLVTWTGEKWGGPVTAPDLTPKDDNTVLLRSGNIDHAPQLGPDGVNYIYMATGWAVYKFLDLSTVNKTYPRVPFLNVDMNRLPPSPVDSDMIFAKTTDTSTLRSQQK